MSEINNIKPPSQAEYSSLRNVGERKETAESSQPTTTSSQNTESDKVSLSDTMSQVEKSLADVPTVNQSKVDSIRAAIEDGSYQVDSQQLARKMIDFEGNF
jgi:negative regulator of flagellin synthesis FlgM